jgi:uncharacterized protein
MSHRALALAAEIFEWSLTLAGLVLLWRCVLSPTARQQARPQRFPRWSITLRDFFFFIWFLFGGAVVASFINSLWTKSDSLGADAKTAVATAVGQLGLLLGLAAFYFYFGRNHRAPPETRVKNFVVPGVVTFLISMPIVHAVGWLWHQLMLLAGLPPEEQDLVRMFIESKSPWLTLLMVLLACIGAPVVEELIFRAGLFRYFHTRLPRWSALLVPACLFAALHLYLSTFASLVALGLVFSLAYERTGNIGTPIVAHALFNLNTVAFVFATAPR